MVVSLGKLGRGGCMRDLWVVGGGRGWCWCFGRVYEGGGVLWGGGGGELDKEESIGEGEGWGNCGFRG